jgi:putative nucleotidyltransferase with HDIG domain
MTKPVVVVSDRPDRIRDIESCLGTGFDAIALDPCGSVTADTADAVMMVVDIDLSDRAMIDSLRKDVLRAHRHLPSVFVTEESRRADVIQSNALGASKTVTRRQAIGRLKQIADAYAQTAGLADPIVASDVAIEQAARLSTELFAAVENAEPLPTEQVHQCGLVISDALRQDGIATFLSEVKQHHSYTHRHSMCVTGLAVAFGLHCGMRQLDIQRLATGALMHDIGKARIDLDILDKPDALSPEERDEMRRHPDHGAEILLADAQFEREVVDIARQHHEYLDGSGYPQGLAADQLSDLVRVMTIVDIFSALIDRRSYKKPIPRPTAYQMMQRMHGKIDLVLLQAFEPIALQDI